MPARIGILTYFWRDNPGTFLQAYAMLSALQQRFGAEDVEVINFRLERSGFRLSRADLNPVTFFDHLHRRRLFARHRREHLRLSRRRLISTDPKKAADFIASGGYDAIILGSDTVLELGGAYSRYWQGRIPVYWLPPEVPGVKVVCAASAGAETGESLDEGTREVLKRSIQDFALIGVRDDATLHLMETLGLAGDPRLSRVPDPTFAVDVDPAPGDALATRLGVVDGVPAIGLNLPPDPLSAGLAEHYRAKGYKVFSFVGPENADCWTRGISPFEWAGLPRYLRLVVTDRFHGSIFSLLAGTPVVAVDHKAARYGASGLSKTFSLMKEFGLEKTNHLNLKLSGIQSAEGLIRAVETGVEAFDPDNARQRAAEMRERFHNFLARLERLVTERVGQAGSHVR